MDQELSVPYLCIKMSLDMAQSNWLCSAEFSVLKNHDLFLQKYWWKYQKVSLKFIWFIFLRCIYKAKFLRKKIYQKLELEKLSAWIFLYLFVF